MQLIGVDKSQAMIEKAREKSAFDGSFHSTGHHPIELVCADLLTYPLQKCGLVVMNYTLQFIPWQDRLYFLQEICDALRPGGVLVLAEKIRSEDAIIEQLENQFYWDFKRANGYSELEIAQKRVALEDALVPLAGKTYEQMLKGSGLAHVGTMCSWLNFTCFIGIKGSAKASKYGY